MEIKFTFLCCKISGFCSRWLALRAVFEGISNLDGGKIGLHFAATGLVLPHLYNSLWGQSLYAVSRQGAKGAVGLLQHC